VPSLGTLELTGRLAALGVPNDLAAEAWETIKLHTGALARDIIRMWAERPGAGFKGWPMPDDVAGELAELRPIALRAVQLGFAHAIEDVLEELVESGGVFSVPERPARSRRSSPGDAAVADATDDRGR
jgi:hypothetical protein